MQDSKPLYRFEDLPDILTLFEAAQLLGYKTDDMLRKRAASGDFPAFALFSDEKKTSWRISKQVLKDWIDEKQAAASQAVRLKSKGA